MESPRTSLPSLASAKTRGEFYLGATYGGNLNADVMSSYAFDVIRECAEAWEKLITGKTQPGSVST